MAKNINLSLLLICAIFCLIGNTIAADHEAVPVSSVKVESVSTQSATVSWEAPKKVKGITGYKIAFTMKPLDEVDSEEEPVEISVGSGERIAAVDNLFPSAVYLAQITALYGDSEAAPSEPVEVVTLPESPTDVEVSDITSTTLTVTWSADSTGNVAFKEQIVAYLPSNADPREKPLVVKVDKDQASALLENLTPGIEYMITVVCVNEAGISQPSKAVSATTLTAEVAAAPEEAEEEPAHMLGDDERIDWQPNAVKFPTIARRGFYVAWSKPNKRAGLTHFEASLTSITNSSFVTRSYKLSASSKKLHVLRVMPSNEYMVTVCAAYRWGHSYCADAEIVMTSPTGQSTVACKKRVVDAGGRLTCLIHPIDDLGARVTVRPRDFAITALAGRAFKLRLLANERDIAFGYRAPAIGSGYSSDKAYIVLRWNKAIQIAGSPISYTILNAQPVEIPIVAVGNVTIDAPGSSQAKLSWLVPSHGVLGYEVNIIPTMTELMPMVEILAGTKNSITLTGLIPSALYDVDVVAVYPDGEAPKSPKLSLITLPLPPRTVSVSSAGRDSAVASWDPPLFNGNVVTIDNVLTFTSETGKVVEYHTKARSYNATAHGLEPSTKYTMSIENINAGGRSIASDTVTFMTSPTQLSTITVRSADAVKAGSTKTLILVPRDSQGNAATGIHPEDFVFTCALGTVTNVVNDDDTNRIFATYNAPANLSSDAQDTITITLRYSPQNIEITGSPINIDLDYVPTPLPVTKVSVKKITETQAVVEWVAPSREVIGYNVQVTSQATDVLPINLYEAANTTKITLTNLMPSALYKVVVVAQYPDSVTVPGVGAQIRTLPLPPASVSIVDTDRTTVDIKWAGPIQNGNIVVVDQIIVATPIGNPEAQTVTVQTAKRTRKWTVEGLVPSTKYELSVININVAGQSQPSDPVQFTTSPTAKSQVSLKSTAAISQGQQNTIVVNPLSFSGDATSPDVSDYTFTVVNGTISNIRVSGKLVLATYTAPIDFTENCVDLVRVYLSHDPSKQQIKNSPLSVPLSYLAPPPDRTPVGDIAFVSVAARSAVLAFEAPSAFVTGYEVRIQPTAPGSVAVVVALESYQTTANLTNLQPSAVYKVRVIALYENGPAASSGSAMLRTLPIPPKDVKITAAPRTSFTIKCIDNEDMGNAKITNVIINYSHVDKESGQTVSASIKTGGSRTATITGLIPTTEYSVSVIYVNDAGQATPYDAFEVQTAPTFLSDAALRSAEPISEGEGAIFRITPRDMFGNTVAADAADFTWSAAKGKIKSVSVAPDGKSLVLKYLAPEYIKSKEYDEVSVFLSATGDQISGSPVEIGLVHNPPVIPHIPVESAYVSDVGATFATVSWTALDAMNLTGFIVRVTTSLESVQPLLLTAAPDQTSVKLSGLMPSNLYRVEVVSQFTDGPAAASAPVELRTFPVPPKTLTIEDIARTQATLKIENDLMGNLRIVETYITLTAEGGVSEIRTLGHRAPKSVLANLNVSTTYTVTVSVANIAGQSAESTPIQFTTIPTKYSEVRLKNTAPLSEGKKTTIVVTPKNENLDLVEAKKSDYLFTAQYGEITKIELSEDGHRVEATYVAPAEIEGTLVDKVYVTLSNNVFGHEVINSPVHIELFHASKLIPVGDVVVADVSTTSAQISWEAPSKEVDSYSVQVTVTATKVAPAINFETTEASATLTNLIPSSLYNVVVVANYKDGIAAASPAHEMMTLPMPPKTVQAASIGRTTIDLEWSEPSQNGNLVVIGNVITWTTDGAEPVSVVLKERSRAFTMDNLIPSTKYTITVTNQNADGLSDPSDPIEVTTSPTFVSDVSLKDYSALSEYQHVTIKIQPRDQDGNFAVADIEDFVFTAQYGTISNVRLSEHGKEVEATYTAPDHIDGQVKEIIAVSLVHGGSTLIGSPIKIDLIHSATKTPVSAVTVESAGTNTAVLSWDSPSEEIIGYEVRVTTQMTGVLPINIVTAGNETSVTVNGLLASTLYNVDVLAEYPEGFAQPCPAHELATLPLPPASVTAENIGRTSVELDWEAPTTSGNLVIVNEIVTVIAKDSTALPHVIRTDQRTRSLTVSNLLPSTVYTATVTNINADGSSEPSKEIEFTTAPTAQSTLSQKNPTILSENQQAFLLITPRAADGSNAEPNPEDFVVNVDFGKVSAMRLSSNKKALVFIYTAPSEIEGQQVAKVSVSLANGVKADVAGSPITLQLQHVNPPIKHVPVSSITVVSTSTDMAELAWQVPSSEVSGYRVRVSVSMNSDLPVIEIPVSNDTTSTTVTNLVPSTLYFVTVVSEYADGDAPASITHEIMTLPMPPRSVGVKSAGRTTASAIWDLPLKSGNLVLVDNILRYTLADQTNGKTKTVKVGHRSRNATLTGLVPARKYALSVANVNADGSSDYSDAVEFFTAPTDRSSVTVSIDGGVVSENQKVAIVITPRDMLGAISEANIKDFKVEAELGSVSRPALSSDKSLVIVTYTAPSKISGTQKDTITVRLNNPDKTVVGDAISIPLKHLPRGDEVSGVVVAAVTSSQATVSWNPSDNEDLSGYVINLSTTVDGQTITSSIEVDASSNSAVVRGLIPSNEYTVSVTTKLGEVLTKPSKSVPLVTLAMPPRSISVDSIMRSSAVINWQESEIAGNVEVTAVVITLSRVEEPGSQDVVVRTNKVKDGQYSLTLDPSTRYSVFIAFENRQGLSLPSQSVEFATGPTPLSTITTDSLVLDEKSSAILVLTPRSAEGYPVEAFVDDFVFTAKLGKIARASLSQDGQTIIVTYNAPDLHPGDNNIDEVSASLALSRNHEQIAGSPLRFEVTLTHNNFPVGQPTVSNVTTTSAVVTWAYPDGALGLTGYKVVAQVPNSDLVPEVSVTLSLDDPLVATLEGLVPSTYYNVIVYGIYDEQLSEASPVEAIKTRPLAPLELFLDTVTRDSVAIHWEHNSQNGNLVILDNIIITRNLDDDKAAPVTTKLGKRVQSTTVSDLLPSSRYEIRVININAAGESQPSVGLVFTTSPSALSEVQAKAPIFKAGQKTTRIVVSPKDQSGNVATADVSDFVFAAEHGSVSEASLLPNGDIAVTYTAPTSNIDHDIVTVRLAHGTKSQVANSPIALNLKASSHPPAVGLRVVKVAASEATISWSVPDSPTATIASYKIKAEVEATESVKPIIFSAPAEATSLDLTGLSPSSLYHISITVAYTDKKYAKQSKTIELMTVPMPPTNLVAQDVARTGFTLTWSPAEEAGNLVILSEIISYVPADVADAVPTTITVERRALKYEITGLNPSTKYLVTVAQVNTQGSSVASEALVVTTSPTPLSTATSKLEILYPGEQSYILITPKDELGNPADAVPSDYIVTSKVAKVGQPKLTSTGKSVVVPIEAPHSGENLYDLFVVELSNSPIKDQISGSPVSVLLKLNPYPIVVDLAVTAATEDSASLSWNYPPGGEGVTGYRLLYKVDATEAIKPTVVELNENATSYTIAGLTPSTLYDARIIALYGGPHNSGPSEAVEIKTLPLPPSAVSIVSSDRTSISIRWSNPTVSGNLVVVDNVITYADADATDAQPATLSLGMRGRKATITGLNPSTRYSISVSNVNVGGQSRPSEATYSTTSPTELTTASLVVSVVRLEQKTAIEIQPKDEKGNAVSALPEDFKLVAAFGEVGVPRLDDNSGKIIVPYTAPAQGIVEDTVEIMLAGGVHKPIVSSPISVIVAVPVSELSVDTDKVGPTFAAIDFTAPSPAIAGYKIVATPVTPSNISVPVETSVQANSTVTSIEISGLLPSNTYKAVIIAIYEDGVESPASEEVLLRTLPESPVDIKVVTTGRTELTIGWTPSKIAGDLPIKGQVITLTDVKGKTKTRKVDGDADTMTFSGLNPSNEYTIVVATVNQVGVSTDSHPLDAMTSPSKLSVLTCDTFILHPDESVACSILARDMNNEPVEAEPSDFKVSAKNGYIADVHTTDDSSRLGLRYTAPDTGFGDEITAILALNPDQIQLSGSPYEIEFAGIPKDLKVESFDATSATISWTAVENQNRLTGYRATFTPEMTWDAEPIVVDAPVNVTEFVFAGLLPSTLYSVSLSALYQGEAGPESAAVEVATLPAAPLNLRVSSTGRTSVDIEWDPSNPSGNLVILQNVVSVALASNPETPIDIEKLARNSTATIYGLTPSTTYVITVTATNRAGSSLPTEPLTVTTSPTAQSYVECDLDEVRPGDSTQCSIYVRDENNQPAVADTDDFSISAGVGAVSFPVATDSVDRLVFNYQAPMGDASLDMIRVVLSNNPDIAIRNSPVEMILHESRPGPLSVVACDQSFARWGEPMHCHITAVTRGLTPAHSFPSDFKVTVENAEITPLVSNNGGITFNFTLTATSPSRLASVTVRLAEDDVDITGSPMNLEAFGTPSTKSKVTCRERVAPIRVGSAQRCLIYSLDQEGNPLPSLPIDFKIRTNVGSVSKYLTRSSDDNTVWAFSYRAPTEYTAENVTITVVLTKSKEPITNSGLQVAIAGEPSVSSQIMCEKTENLKKGESIQCVISPRDNSGSIKAYRKDFSMRADHGHIHSISYMPGFEKISFMYRAPHTNTHKADSLFVFVNKDSAQAIAGSPVHFTLNAVDEDEDGQDQMLDFSEAQEEEHEWQEIAEEEVEDNGEDLETLNRLQVRGARAKKAATNTTKTAKAAKKGKAKASKKILNKN